MGYYTSYTMDVRNVKTKEEHEALVEALREAGVFGYALRDDYYNRADCCSSFDNYDPVKWYEHNDDMVKISKLFPDMTFKLWGNGDSDDDRWYALYKNGDYEEIYSQVVWPEPELIKWDGIL